MSDLNIVDPPPPWAAALARWILRQADRIGKCRRAAQNLSTRATRQTPTYLRPKESLDHD